MGIKRYLKPQVSTEGFFDRFKAGKPKIDPYAPSESIKALKETYLNKEWLAKQKFASGELTLVNGPSYVNVKDVNKSWHDLVSGFNATQQANSKLLLEFDRQLKPYKDSYKTSTADSIQSTRLLKNVEQLKTPELFGLRYPNHGDALVVPALTSEGVRTVAEAVVDILKQKTDFDDKVSPVLDRLITDWVGAGATYRADAAHDSDADLIARAIAGHVEELDNAYRGSNVVVEELLNDARTELIAHLMKWINQSVK